MRRQLSDFIFSIECQSGDLHENSTPTQTIEMEMEAFICFWISNFFFPFYLSHICFFVVAQDWAFVICFQIISIENTVTIAENSS